MSEEPKKTIWESIAPAAFTLFGVLVTSLVTYLSALQAASLNGYQSCLSRVDQKELEIRKKAERFTVSIADLLSLSTHNQTDLKKTESASDEILRSGYALSSYAGDELSNNTLLLALTITKRVDMSSTRNIEESESDQITKDYKESLSGWRESYRSQMKEFNKERLACGS